MQGGPGGLGEGGESHLQPHPALCSIPLHAEVLHTTYYTTLTCNLQHFPLTRCSTPYLPSSQCITHFHRIVSSSGPTSSPLHPLVLTTVIVPDFSSESVTSLLNLLKQGTTTINGPQVEEVIKLARVLELRELEEEEVSGGLDLAGDLCCSAGILPERRPGRLPPAG